jgi:hypothetical protein
MLRLTAIILTTLISTQVFAEEGRFNNSQWSCSGYCFLGGDTPTNPWQPVYSEGATEQEARDNIDCGPYEEVGITCRENKS